MVRLVAIVALFLLLPRPAVATVDVQVYGGSGPGTVTLSGADGQTEVVDVRANDLGITVHVSPLDAVPLAVGLGYVSEKPRIISTTGGAELQSFDGHQLALEIMGWIPMSGLAFYGKLGEVIVGTYRAVGTFAVTEGDDRLRVTDMTYDGRYAALGLGAAITAGFGIFAEARGRFGGTLKETDASVRARGDRDARGQDLGEVQSFSLLVGLELGV